VTSLHIEELVTKESPNTRTSGWHRVPDCASAFETMRHPSRSSQNSCVKVFIKHCYRSVPGESHCQSKISQGRKDDVPALLLSLSIVSSTRFMAETGSTMGAKYAHRYLRVDGELQAKRKHRCRFLRRRGGGGNDRQFKNSGVLNIKRMARHDIFRLRFH